MKDPIAEVAVPRPLERTFDYRVPPELADLPVGVRVRVPFGQERLVGYLVRRKAQSDFKGRLQPLLAALDEEPVLGPAALALAEWLSRFYLCPLGLVLQAMLPRSLGRSRPARGKRVQLKVPLAQSLRALEGLQARAPAQARLLQALLNAGPLGVQELLRRTGSSYGPLRALADRGLVRLSPACPPRLGGALGETPAAVRLTPAQASALEKINNALGAGGGKFLLHGVNGSGKTEVYLGAVAAALRAGRTALLLVPEIALTPQLLARARARLGEALAVVHSGLTPAQRAREWTRLRAREARAVLGVRAAVLLPLEDLGLIVVDEEHEPTYRQEGPEPSYHARAVALQRAGHQGATVVLGSATPSLEAFHLAQSGVLGRLELPERVVAAPPPRVEVVDMCQRRRALSPELEGALGDCLARGQQAMLLLNRRGYGVAHCPRCRKTQRCPRCAIALTFHLKSAGLCCHYCGHAPARPVCPDCGGELEFFGAGTQRLEAILRRKFPTARLARMDSDAVKRGQHAEVLERFRRGQLDVLLGTQMVGLGHDFLNVALMGIVEVDAQLDLPDFRAAERTFQLISQAAGRAGRGREPGRVVLQTRHPEHYAIRHAARGDYAGFAREELGYRRALGYPPFAHLIRLTVEHAAEEKARTQARALAGSLAALPDLEVLGPARRLPYRWRGQYGWQLLLKTGDVLKVRDALLERVKRWGPKARVRLEVDP